MYKGKHHSPRHAAPVRRKRRSGKPTIVFFSVLVLLAAAAMGTLALIQVNTGTVSNTFVPPNVNISINENKTQDLKSDITFTNTGDTEVYIRAALVIYWQDTIDGELVTVAKPEGASVTVGDPAGGWFRVGDIFYYSLPVAPGGQTAVMNGENRVTGIPDGSTASCIIDVRAEAIQASPADAVEAAWQDVDVAGTGLVAAAAG